MSDPHATLPIIKMAARRRPGTESAPVQLELRPRTWGGKRKGAGRPKTGRTKVAHRTRPHVTRHTPVHVTLRLRADLPSLRFERIFRIVRGALADVCDRDGFRICHFSVQGNHIHLLCEADDEAALAGGVRAFELRLTRRLNATLGRKGSVFADRYHSRVLKTPLEVKNCLRYVLLNGRRHAAQQGRRIGPEWFDPCSSAAWFDGWAERLSWREPWMRELRRKDPPTAAARSWLLAKGWREKRGPISISDTPGPRPPGA